MKLRIASIVSPFSVALILACGGSATPKAETPAPEAPSESASTTESKPEPAPEPAAAAPKELAKEVILHEGTAFLLNHQKSDMGVAATAACEKQSKGDVAKKANCTSKAINKMKREGFMLEEDKSAGDDEEGGNGHWLFVRFNITDKSIKIETNRVPVDVVSSSGNTLKLKTSGPDKSARKQGTVPSEMTFEVPDEYTIITHEEGRGKLVFEPKMGLFAKD